MMVLWQIKSPNVKNAGLTCTRRLVASGSIEIYWSNAQRLYVTRRVSLFLVSFLVFLPVLCRCTVLSKMVLVSSHWVWGLIFPSFVPDTMSQSMQHSVQAAKHGVNCGPCTTIGCEFCVEIVFKNIAVTSFCTCYLQDVLAPSTTSRIVLQLDKNIRILP